MPAIWHFRYINIKSKIKNPIHVADDYYLKSFKVRQAFKGNDEVGIQLFLLNKDV